MKEQLEKYGGPESQRRLSKILQGAFSAPPTQLKDIPKKSGKSRVQRKKPTKRRVSAAKIRSKMPR